MNKCKKHPKYKAIRRPCVCCTKCAKMYEEKRKDLDWHIFGEEKPIIGTDLKIGNETMKGYTILDYYPTEMFDGKDEKIVRGYAYGIIKQKIQRPTEIDSFMSYMDRFL